MINGEAFRARLSGTVHDTETTAGRVFDRVVISLIIVSIVSFSIETSPDLPSSMRPFLAYSEAIITILFTLEYGLRIYVAPKKIQYIFSFYGLIDLLAILPFYIATGIDLRALRAFRLLKVVRYTHAIMTFAKALSVAKGQLITFGFATLLMLFISSAIIFTLENQADADQFRSVLESLWWVIESLLRIDMGYRDMHPITTGGKVFAHIMMLYGIVLVAVPAGIFASALSKVYRERERDEANR